MLVLFLLGLLLTLIVRSLPTTWRRMVWHAMFWVTMWSIVWLLLVQLELVAISPDGTYGSDARYYYEKMRITLEAGKWWPSADVFNPGYVAFGALVLHTSPTKSVVWVKLANIGLLLISLALGFYMLQQWGISKRVAYLVIMLAGTNGIVTWMVCRNLKDTLILFLTLALIAGVKALLSKDRHIPMLLRISSILLFSFVGAEALRTVRPWGIYWTLGIVGATIIEPIFGKGLGLRFKILKSSLFATLALSVAFIVWVVHSYQAVIRDFLVAVYYAERAGGLVGVGLIDIVLAPARFLIGPGPIRAIFGHEVFWVTTTMGNILIALGSIMWWVYLPLLLMAVLRGPSYWLKYASVLIPLFIFLAAYSFAYSGSLETRFRAIVYVLSLLGTAPYLDIIMQRRKAGWGLRYAMIASVVWIGGTIASYITLTGL